MIGDLYDVAPFVPKDTKYGDVRNCRGCGSSYTKDGFWCQISKVNSDPVGYCCFCDKNSKFYTI